MKHATWVAGTALLATSAAIAQGAPAPAIPRAADSAFFAENWLRAKTLYGEFLKANPGSLSAHVKAGYVELNLGDPTAAIAHFDAVVAGAPSTAAPLAQAGMAVALGRQGQLPSSLERLEKAVAAGYSNVGAIEQEPSFRPLQGDARFIALRERVRINAMPCLADSTARAFDFWVGEWDVYVNGTAQLAGRNRIDRVSGGCAILENWTSHVTILNGPSEGKSLNFVDPTTRKWRQVWMGSGGGLTNYEQGQYRDGAMRFIYRTLNAQGQRVEGRFLFFNFGPDKVRQLQESTPDGGKTWQTVYDFIYVRTGSESRDSGF
ncbi:MAG: tetratricopeptide repeat protein [Gemmatimonadaceae bacterium]